MVIIFYLSPKLCDFSVEAADVPRHDLYTVRSHLDVVYSLLPLACAPVALLFV